MAPEAYFAEMKIEIVVVLQHYSTPPKWYGRANKSIDGITVKVEASAEDLNKVLTLLELAWKDKTEVLPKEFSVPPQLEYPPFKDVTHLNDDIPF